MASLSMTGQTAPAFPAAIKGAKLSSAANGDGCSKLQMEVQSTVDTLPVATLDTLSGFNHHLAECSSVGSECGNDSTIDQDQNQVQFSGYYPLFNEQRYEFVRVLTSAPRSGGQIELHTDRMTGALVAVKRIFRDRLQDSPASFKISNPSETDDPWKELQLAQALGQPGPDRVHGVCHCEGVYLSAEGDGLLVTEYAAGGDAFDYVSSLGPPGPEREAKVWPVIYSLMTTLSELHARGVAHGDVSLENVCLRRDFAGSEVMLVDFGMAVTGDHCNATGARGKPSYQAPEMHTEPCYDARAADLFACGVAAFTLVVGGYPWNSTRPGICPCFQHTKKYGLQAFLQKKRIVMDGARVPLQDVLSVPFQQLLSMLLSLDPSERFKAAHFLGVEAGSQATPTTQPPHMLQTSSQQAEATGA